jgi:hypothetical protein
MAPTQNFYSLSVSYLSNERPFSTIYEPYPRNRFKDDDEAREWFEGMQAGLDGYTVTLLKNGKAIDG